LYSNIREVALTEITTAVVEVFVCCKGAHDDGVEGSREWGGVPPSPFDGAWGSVMSLFSGVRAQPQPTPAQNEFGAFYLS